MAVKVAMAEAEEFSNYAPPRQKWTLTKEAFAKMLAALDPDADLAGEKYLVIGRNLVRFFEGRGCQFADDHADEVINRVAKKVGEGEAIRDINAYCYGVARMLLLEVFKDQARQANALNEMSRHVIQSGPEELDGSGERLECLNGCLEKLPSEGRRLVLGYYQGDKQSRIENRKRLTISLGIPNQALRSRAVRLREKLEACLSICLKKAPTQIRRFGH